MAEVSVVERMERGITGQTYLRECRKGVAEVIRSGDAHKLFGDVDLDLLVARKGFLLTSGRTETKPCTFTSYNYAQLAT